MTLLGKSRSGIERAARPQASAGAVPANVRASNALKEFLWLVGDVQRGSLLDLGPVWQSTVNFFTDRGFKVYTEDLLRAWKEFLQSEEKRLREAPVSGAPEAVGEFSTAALAERFIEVCLQYSPETFHAVLAWDLFDYLGVELLPRVANRLYDLLKPAGVMLAVFHSKPPDGFHRYRVVDAQSVELLHAQALFTVQRCLQNREILNLFSRFRSSKTFMGRDQLREGLFTK